MIRRVRPWFIAFVLCGCVSSELDLPATHPANASAPTTPLTPGGGALSAEFDALAPVELGHSHDLTAEAGEPASEATQYTCPMHPEIVRSEPGNCPICGMKLVPVKPKEQEAKP